MLIVHKVLIDGVPGHLSYLSDMSTTYDKHLPLAWGHSSIEEEELYRSLMRIYTLTRRDSVVLPVAGPLWVIFQRDLAEETALSERLRLTKGLTRPVRGGLH